MSVHRPLVVDHDLNHRFGPVFKDESQLDRLALFQLLGQPQQHDMVAPPRQHMRATRRQRDSAFNRTHAHHALVVLVMRVKLGPLGGVGPGGGDPAIGRAVVVQDHEGGAGLRHRAGGAGIGIFDREPLAGKGGEGQEGRGGGGGGGE